MKVKIDEIRNMSAIEREKKLSDLRNELFKLHSSNAMGGTLTDPTKIRQIKRAVARILTVQNELKEI
ncbi:50S ribosomal protein L29 [Candidatus Lokiarchaeum ossiferum]|uniref:Large ribosomal subunit protein uL29 n=1 Tax=Candidatus Lokiarchaeum ossiferum TaxID=2951803 RepID=A0ABY6HUU0_9ARCH|nr:50S ribosomal protein L29 [Candidatus Lokiarchaeum sp. B-35]